MLECLLDALCDDFFWGSGNIIGCTRSIDDGGHRLKWYQIFVYSEKVSGF
jgi:hypothetical protein